MKEYTLNFGKHSGKSILEVWKGNLNAITNTVIENYIDSFIDFLFGRIDIDKHIIKNSYSFSNKDIEFINTLYLSSSLRDTIKVNKSRIRISDSEISNQLSDLLIKCFNYSHFNKSHLNVLKHKDSESEELNLDNSSLELAKHIPEPSYIEWCFEEIEGFKEKSNISLEYLKKQESYYPSIILDKVNKNEIRYKLLAYVHFHE
ncbi:hypothetical protein [Mesoflavibacter sp. SCSIO 43206]|uniref:hypothetical protein n=1 Tax=Mesoflavibacter sp. SCSIO 43206 TaxID=2779362 RepID=UPI001CA8CA12|nr:hypothetical protein [Mesoflavibacter sp. SCSIO 43206]UAB74307.1 hypothetical protein INR78_07830 [Mesoflavibacter sp. SCSIO 43206]